MGIIITLIRDNDIFIIIGLIALIVLVFIILIANNIKISKLSRKYKKFMKGGKDRSIGELLIDLMDEVRSSSKKSDSIKILYEEIDNRLNKCVQKVSIIRYKAFDNMGSAQSFSIALLDAGNNGVIITGIYGRNECITYAKQVDNGVPKYELSDEEKNVLQDAMKKNLIYKV